MRIAKPTPFSKKLVQEFRDKFRKKEDLLWEYLEHCLLTGAPIPKIRIFWNRAKLDFDVEIGG